ncbi:hypothetical protein SMD11_6619 [Streptomyces albireticuli]|uniref:Uncharacterized protein n=1 Tax=Streptomyces albireticuli TaxID=1940 RepID=A0A1Z2LD43_9ACTN|nr:hypothetical protein SMD11_6619 [Streptomyces albireticuli]
MADALQVVLDLVPGAAHQILMEFGAVRLFRRLPFPISAA